MPNRKSNSQDYRYGYNGMEKDDETYAESGTAYDFGARIYSSRLGRWLSPDPLYDIYPEYSPYVFAGNSPIRFVDVDGEGFNGGFSVTNQSTEPITLVGTSLTVINGFWNDTETESKAKEITLEPGQRFEAVVNPVENESGEVIGEKFTGKIVQFAELDADGKLVNLKEERLVDPDADVFDIDNIKIKEGQTFVDNEGNLRDTDPNTPAANTNPTTGVGTIKTRSGWADATTEGIFDPSEGDINEGKVNITGNKDRLNITTTGESENNPTIHFEP